MKKYRFYEVKRGRNIEKGSIAFITDIIYKSKYTMVKCITESSGDVSYESNFDEEYKFQDRVPGKNYFNQLRKLISGDRDCENIDTKRHIWSGLYVLELSTTFKGLTYSGLKKLCKRFGYDQPTYLNLREMNEYSNEIIGVDILKASSEELDLLVVNVNT